MKIKLNKKQIADIGREIKATERRNHKTEDVFDIFKMLQYWTKSIGGKETKIKSVTELDGGYLCRVNSVFRERMKAYLKQIRQRKAEQYAEAKKKKEVQDVVDKYDDLIREAEEAEMQKKRR